MRNHLSQTSSYNLTILFYVPSRLKRYYTGKDLHFITCSCYRRRPLLGTAHRRDLFLKILEQARQRYRFVVVGYVVMPEHFHLLISEPDRDDPSVVMKVVKQRFARKVRPKRSSAQFALWDQGHPSNPFTSDDGREPRGTNPGYSEESRETHDGGSIVPALATSARARHPQFRHP